MANGRVHTWYTSPAVTASQLRLQVGPAVSRDIIMTIAIGIS